MFEGFLSNELADLLFPKFDIVVGATDNYNSRYLIDRKSIEHKIPFVHGAIPGIIGSMMVIEVIKILTGVGKVLSGKLLLYNVADNIFNQLLIR